MDAFFAGQQPKSAAAARTTLHVAQSPPNRRPHERASVSAGQRRLCRQHFERPTGRCGSTAKPPPSARAHQRPLYGASANTAASPRKGGAWCLAPGGLRGAVFIALWEEHCARITPMNSQRWQCAVRLPRDAGDPGRARRVDRSATAASEASISVYQFSTAKMMSWSPPTCSRGIFVAVRAPSVASAGKDVFLGLLPR